MDLAAMLGSVYLDPTADLCMANIPPQVPLSAAWYYILPAKVAMPYLTRVCDHKDKGSTQSILAANALAADSFIKLLSNYKQQGDPVMSTIVPLLPHMHPNSLKIHKL